MIRLIDIRLNAAHPELPLAEAVTYTGAPSTMLIRGVPGNCGKWCITSVYAAATFPDGSTTTRTAVQSANGVWVATLPATNTSGRTANGIRIMADGEDENGELVTGYILGVADFAVASLGVTPAPEPGATSWQMLYFDAVPGTLRKGDVTKIDGVLSIYNGTAWEPFAAPVTFDNAVTRDSANGVKSSGIWSALWGALSSLPAGFTSLYDWVVAQLAGKVSKSGDTMTGGLTVPNLTVGSRASGSTIGTNSTAEGSRTTASGNYSHAEGGTTTASGDYSHAEGGLTTASGENSHAEGGTTTASGDDSHAEGYHTTASGEGSHAEGYHTIAQNDSEHAQGQYNASHKASTTFGNAGNTLSSIGFGTADNARKNAVETMQDGKTYIYGLGNYNGTNPAASGVKDLATAVEGKLNKSGGAMDITYYHGPLTADNQIVFAISAQGAYIGFKSGGHTIYISSDRITIDGQRLALTAANPTAGNLAALDAQGNPTDAGWTAGDLARYALTTKTINNGAVTLDDRAINAVTVSSALASLTVNFPTATSGKVRDFGLRLTVASGVTTAPQIVLPQGVTCENADGEAPEIGADGAATILYFTETASGVFLVKGEVLQTIA